MEVTLKIDGLTCPGCNCGHCPEPMLNRLAALKCVNRVVLDFDEDTLLIDIDEWGSAKQEIEAFFTNEAYHWEVKQ